PLWRAQESRDECPAWLADWHRAPRRRKKQHAPDKSAADPTSHRTRSGTSWSRPLTTAWVHSLPMEQIHQRESLGLGLGPGFEAGKGAEQVADRRKVQEPAMHVPDFVLKSALQDLGFERPGAPDGASPERNDLSARQRPGFQNRELLDNVLDRGARLNFKPAMHLRVRLDIRSVRGRRPCCRRRCRWRGLVLRGRGFLGLQSGSLGSRR